MVSLWFFSLFLNHVPANAVEYMAGIFWCQGAEPGCDSAVDMETALELGLSWDCTPTRSRSVCLWILQRDADLYDPGADHHGSV